MPVPPEWLDPLAQRIYLETARAFADLEDKDPDLLVSYAQAAALVEDMQRQIREQGLSLPNARGYPAAHPLLNPLKGWLREKTNLSQKIRKNFKPSKESDGFA